ncbi:hypothetical protein EMEDMD4_940015 [Sinorhizobium medicae]|uniref:Uncharacterized protein n=1 Tax=Sinorhizobium medicae TaxID=110321 RepID=A0A508XCB5_9HYPH|nr:hypothetical protein EMEDMD4_940015 [Sinorhizobium medicae]
MSQRSSPQPNAKWRREYGSKSCCEFWAGSIPAQSLSDPQVQNQFRPSESNQMICEHMTRKEIAR